MDEIHDLKAHVLMLEHVTTALWANFIANTQGDTSATFSRVSEKSLQNLEAIYSRFEGQAPSPSLHTMVQAILHHEEGFWQQVGEQMRLR